MPYPNYPAYQPNYQQMQQVMPNYFTPPMQQMIQQNQQPSLGGKIVENIDVVKAIDIPMDGNNYYFPKADGSEIYIKKWLPNGTTDTVIFKKSEPEQISEEPKIDFNAMENNIIDRLTAIDERLGKLEKGLASKSTSTRKE